jgi:hypothetical protein
VTIAPNDLVEGIDLSNHQGILTGAILDAIVTAGKRFAIVRLSTEDDARRNIAIQQCESLRERGLAVLGYCWVYWWQDVTAAMVAYMNLAARCRVRILALDWEADLPVSVDPVAWLLQAKRALESARYIPLAYTYPYWWQKYDVDLSPLGDIRWWVAQWNGRHDLQVTLPYEGARVVAHQYADTSDVPGIALDSDVMTFDQQMADAVNGNGAGEMTEAQVRAIVQQELDAVAGDLGQGTTFSGLMRLILGRIDAAGKALDLDVPPPTKPLPGG